MKSKWGARDLLTRDVVLTYLRLRDNGQLVWFDSKGRSRCSGPAGTMSQGRLMIQINGHKFNARDIIWVLTHGSLPPSGVMNINGDLADNRPENLAAVDPREIVSFL